MSEATLIRIGVFDKRRASLVREAEFDDGATVFVAAEPPYLAESTDGLASPAALIMSGALYMTEGRSLHLVEQSGRHVRGGVEELLREGLANPLPVAGLMVTVSGISELVLYLDARGARRA